MVERESSLQVVDKRACVLGCEGRDFSRINQLVNSVDNRQLTGCSLRTSESCPIVDDNAFADLSTTSVDRSCTHGHLGKRPNSFELSN